MIQKILLFSQPSSWLFLFSWFQRTEWQWQQDRDLSWRMNQSLKVNQNYFFKNLWILPQSDKQSRSSSRMNESPEQSTWHQSSPPVISPGILPPRPGLCCQMILLHGRGWWDLWCTWCSTENISQRTYWNEQRDLVPVDASLLVSCLLHTETALCWSILVEWKISATMHPVVVTLGANVRWHEVIIIKLVVETGDSDKTSSLQLLNLSSPTHWIQVFEWASSDNIHWCSISVSADLPTSELRWYRRWRRRRSTREERCQAWEEYQGATSQEFSCLQRT